MSKTKNRTDLPTLYKRTATGSIQQWHITVEVGTITVTHGQVGGKLQTTTDTIKSGKNAGRKNATAPEEQALKEANSQWTKKLKNGYVQDLLSAKFGKTDSIIKGGVLPMLAKVYEDHKNKIKFPVMVQPKLDGHRCIAVIKNGNVSLWTRTRKRITSVPHIEDQLTYVAARVNHLRNAVLDGELYNHKFKKDFEAITSATRKKEATEESAQIQYHVYDLVSRQGFEDRYSGLSDIVIHGGDRVHLVDSVQVDSESQINGAFNRFLEEGYEGAMVRILGILYENKRSSQLLKVKIFEDDEFEIIGVEEGRGKLQGHAGAFVLQDGKEFFRAKMSGNTKKLKEYWQEKDKYIGQMLTVQFQGRTGDGIPRFPVGIRIREDL